MRIKVLFDQITIKQYNDVIEYYNKNKTSDLSDLEKLDRAEGGFQIRLLFDNYRYKDPNDTIKQLRWKNKILDPLFYIGFTDIETKLLYDALCYVFGDNQIVLCN
jgi:hypothetical protein